MIVIIDNYDSFTYNLYQYVGEINVNVKVIRNDKIALEQLEKMKPSHLIVSPGPGYPQQAGISIGAIKAMGPRIPVLGVCLGHQAISVAYGGHIAHAAALVHGKAHDINLHSGDLFKKLPRRMRAGRYHSLVVDKNTLPDALDITAETDDGEIMSIQHKTLPVFGVQFHPESILTPHGKRILENFLSM